MTELSRAHWCKYGCTCWDIGVGGREVGFMFGQYKRLRNEFTGILTGKDFLWGFINKTEATGYGNVYFAQSMLETKGSSFAGKTVVLVPGTLLNILLKKQLN
jgi:glutamate dehydrogenase (NADP+)